MTITREIPASLVGESHQCVGVVVEQVLLGGHE